MQLCIRLISSVHATNQCKANILIGVKFQEGKSPRLPSRLFGTVTDIARFHGGEVLGNGLGCGRKG